MMAVYLFILSLDRPNPLGPLRGFVVIKQPGILLTIFLRPIFYLGGLLPNSLGPIRGFVKKERPYICSF
jgi:hypothetical protein